MFGFTEYMFQYELRSNCPGSMPNNDADGQREVYEERYSQYVMNFFSFGIFGIWKFGSSVSQRAS